jgi:hypothetical protein
MIYKTLHRKLKIKKQELAVLLLNDTNIISEADLEGGMRGVRPP